MVGVPLVGRQEDGTRMIPQSNVTQIIPRLRAALIAKPLDVSAWSKLIKYEVQKFNTNNNNNNILISGKQNHEEIAHFCKDLFSASSSTTVPNRGSILKSCAAALFGKLGESKEENSCDFINHLASFVCEELNQEFEKSNHNSKSRNGNHNFIDWEIPYFLGKLQPAATNSSKQFKISKNKTPIDYFLLATKLHPTSDAPFFALADAYRKSNQLEKACHIYQQIVDSKNNSQCNNNFQQDNAKACYRAGEMLIKLKKFDEGRRFLQRARDSGGKWRAPAEKVLSQIFPKAQQSKRGSHTPQDVTITTQKENVCVNNYNVGNNNSNFNGAVRVSQERKPPVILPTTSSPAFANMKLLNNNNFNNFDSKHHNIINPRLVARNIRGSAAARSASAGHHYVTRTSTPSSASASASAHTAATLPPPQIGGNIGSCRQVFRHMTPPQPAFQRSSSQPRILRPTNSGCTPSSTLSSVSRSSALTSDGEVVFRASRESFVNLEKTTNFPLAGTTTLLPPPTQRPTCATPVQVRVRRNSQQNFATRPPLASLVRRGSASYASPVPSHVHIPHSANIKFHRKIATNAMCGINSNSSNIFTQCRGKPPQNGNNVKNLAQKSVLSPAPAPAPAPTISVMSPNNIIITGSSTIISQNSKSNPQNTNKIYNINCVQKSVSASSPQRKVSALRQTLDDEFQIRYEDLQIGDCLGRGELGSVHRGVYNNSEVAIKTFTVRNGQDLPNDAMEVLKREILSIKNLEHPRLVQFVGACLRLPNLAIVTEFCPGGNLCNLLHHNQEKDDNNDHDFVLDLPQKFRIAIQLLEGVVFLHSRSPVVIHRDLKSMNVVLDENLNVKICDFGLTTNIKDVGLIGGGAEAEGSPRYMPPECYEDPLPTLTEKVDIWASACILIEIFGGGKSWKFPNKNK